MNRVILIGRTTADIELKNTGETTFAKFSLAVPRKKEGVDFINCTAFGKTAEVLEKYVKKGHRVAVVGRIQTGSYEKDGRTVYTTDVIVEEFEFLNNKSNEEKSGFQNTQEELPF